MHHNTLLSVVFLALTLLAGCAKQGMPSGGPKDVTPPQQKKTVPENRSLGFAGNSFFIEFDEYVVLKDAENNILVSPPMKIKPEYKTKGHGIQVKIKDTLQANTTYVFQFKNAIADFNEGNLLPSLDYVFSTGDFIDSMTVRGRVVDAMTLEPREEAVSVWLMTPPEAERFMASLGDSAATAPKLEYYTRCDKDGTFAFNYLAPGRYKIFAVVDENKNLQIEPGESVAFATDEVEAKNMNDSAIVDSILRSAADTEPVELLMFSPNTDKQRITGCEFTAAGKVRMTTLLPLDEPLIDAGGEEVTLHLNSKRDTLTLWTLREKCDSLRLVVCDRSGIGDTLLLRWRPKKGKGTTTAMMQLGNGFEMKLNNKTLPFFDTLLLLFNTPLRGLCGTLDSTVRVKCLKDSSLTTCATIVDSSMMCAAVVFDFIPGEKYEVTVPKGCFYDIYGRGNDSLCAAVSVTKTEEYGNLTVVVRDSSLLLPGSLPPTYTAIVQLLDEKGTVVASENAVANVSKTPFPHLKPGKYRVRAIVDENRNGKWDTGDFAAGIQPERVVYLPKTLEIRANWDFEEILEVSK